MPRIFDDVTPDESADGVMSVPMVSGIAAEIAAAQATVAQITQQVARDALRQQRERLRRVQEEATVTVREITRQVAVDAARAHREQIRRMQDELQENINRHRRETVEILRRRIPRPVVERSCRWSRPRSTIAARTPRRRASAARRLTRAGPRRKRSDPPEPVIREGRRR